MSADELAVRLSRLFPRGAQPPGMALNAAAPAGGPEAPRPECAVDYATRGVHLEVTVQPEAVVSAARVMDEEGFALDAVTGVDWIAESQMEVIYDFYHPASGVRVAARTRIPRETPEIATISEVFPGANWHERETHDFFGIRFLGHPDLTPLLLPEDSTFHPLRKDFRGE
jgi:NADH-quinone oxidoreductase subunit C